jgi:hypothetical protein
VFVRRVSGGFFSNASSTSTSSTGGNICMVIAGMM